jgi:hypothetical protein
VKTRSLRRVSSSISASITAITTQSQYDESKAKQLDSKSLYRREPSSYNSNDIRTKLTKTDKHLDPLALPKEHKEKKPAMIEKLSEKIFIVDSKELAEEVLLVLEKYKDTVFACDTEVTDIDVKTQGPIGNGKVTCVSIYGGNDINFGPKRGKGCAIWVENIEAAEGVLQYFKDWFENESRYKVWHNYGFDRHVMMNEGIDCKGFAGDTMHMARLWDTSRDKSKYFICIVYCITTVYILYELYLHYIIIILIIILIII